MLIPNFGNNRSNFKGCVDLNYTILNASNMKVPLSNVKCQFCKYHVAIDCVGNLCIDCL